MQILKHLLTDLRKFKKWLSISFRDAGARSFNQTSMSQTLSFVYNSDVERWNTVLWHLGQGGIFPAL